MRRHQGKVDDLVGVTGVLDRFNYCYYQYTHGQPVEYARTLRQPAAIRAGRLLSRLQGVTSCIDLPDGLIKTLNDNTPPGLGFLIRDSNIPVKHLPEVINQPNYVSASHPAGDIELLFTASPDRKNQIERAFNKRGLLLHWIGNVTDTAGIQIEMADGQIVAPIVSGFIHKLDGYKLFEK